MKSTSKLIGARIKELRRAKGFSQDQLSERVNIDPKHLSRIELGKSFSSLETLEGIAKVLEVDLKDLFDFSHLEAPEMDKKQIEGLLDGLSQDKLRLIYKVVKSLVK